MTYLRPFWVIFTAVFLLVGNAKAAHAGGCPIQLKMGLLISPDHIRVMQRGRTFVQINNDSQLFINGDLIVLTDQEKYMVREFSLGLRKELPEIVMIAMESMELGFDAFDKVVKSLAGSDSARGIEEHFSKLKNGILEKFARSGDNFYIAPQALNKLDDFFEDELGNQVNQIVTDSLQIMLGAMGEALRENDDGIEGTNIDIGERVKMLSEDVDKSLKINADRIAVKANAFCQRFESLDKTETRLQSHIPGLLKYDILSNQLTGHD
ncbi:YggN family protein [Psychrosphaera sp. B3R10]|uniref:DUF2884 family protein n=1 Tax=unclassified Psychrosphaera TaxID=2641570 RepID=UPI001C09CB6B|nr:MULTISPECIES: DUF2884 family protein [unclassified Psychrosphaera]MBU2882105.1 YggN family protein [Psychrosphaera sp. I2R16]MBU2990193.1 YggN family protein [Psychrosphaera sp. B3R10]MDO6719970.1 DUF2884 family protein [Psychrosphaera sp. 1_MG-2023]